MKFFVPLTLFAAAASAQSFTNSTATAGSNNGVVYVTEVHTAFTTVCSTPTTFAVNNKTYTISSATTLTITNCPCTVVKTTTTPAVHPSAPAIPSGNATHPTVPVPGKPSVGASTVVTQAATHASTRAATATATPTRSIVQAGAAKVGGSMQAAMVAIGAFMLA